MGVDERNQQVINVDVILKSCPITNVIGQKYITYLHGSMALIMYYVVFCFLKKNQNAPRPSELVLFGGPAWRLIYMISVQHNALMYYYTIARIVLWYGSITLLSYTVLYCIVLYPNKLQTTTQ